MSNRASPLLLSAIVGLVAGAVGGVLILRSGMNLMTVEDTAPAPAVAAEKIDADALREAIMENPEVVREALVELQRRQEESQAANARDSITDNADALFRSPGDHVAGNPDGSVTVVEFFDYNCPYCKRAHTDMKALIKNDSDLRFVLKEFPILGPGSMQAARLAVAAKMQGKYMELHNAMFESEGRLDGKRAMQIAREIGLDMDKLQKDAGSEEVKNIITGSLKLAREIGVNGTPGYVVGDELIPGAIGEEGLAEKIAEVRKRADAN